MFIQSSDGFFYKEFIHKISKGNIIIRDNNIDTILTKARTLAILNNERWFVVMNNPQKLGSDINRWGIRFVDWIPTPFYYRYRVTDPPDNYKIFVLKPTEEEIEDIKNGIYSPRVRVAMGGVHLSDNSVRRRLKSRFEKGVIYSY